MDGGAPGWDRFAGWRRGVARAALAAIAAVLLLSVWTALPPQSNPPADSEVGAAGPVRHADHRLHERIAQRVATGESYYRAAIEEQRAAGSPVRPGVAVGLPTMAYLAALMGVEALGALLLLGAAAAAFWFVRLGEEPGGRNLRLVGVAFLLAGMAAGLNPAYLALPDVWAGLLVALAIALHRPGHWHWAWLAAAAALALREHALPLVLLLGVMAAWRRDWRETAAWGALVAIFALGLWLHLEQVNARLLPSDRASEPWLALRGLRGLTSSIVATSPLQLLPAWLAAPLALLPLVGWAGWKSPLGTFATLLCAGYGLLFMIAGRDGGFYWALVVTPVWFVGLAFVPTALRSLWRQATSGQK